VAVSERARANVYWGGFMLTAPRFESWSRSLYYSPRLRRGEGVSRPPPALQFRRRWPVNSPIARRAPKPHRGSLPRGSRLRRSNPFLGGRAAVSAPITGVMPCCDSGAETAPRLRRLFASVVPDVPRPRSYPLHALLSVVLLLGASRASAQDAGARAAPTARATPNVDALLARFRSVPGLEASFREEKRIGLLAAPLVSEGTIHYAPRARLVRHTRTPARSTVLIEGDRLRFGDENGEQAIDLASSPVVRSFVDSFLKVLAGDRRALERIYRIRVMGRAGVADGWEITLVPKNQPLSRIIRELRMSGAGILLERMRIVETSGDETLTTFSRVNARRRYSAAEIARIFRMPARARR